MALRKILGKVTPEGLVPSKHRTPKAESGDTTAAESREAAPGTAANPSAPMAEKPQSDAAAPAKMSEEEARQKGMYLPTAKDIPTLTGSDAGEVEYLYGLTESMRDALRFSFPDCWIVLYVIAMLPVLYGQRRRHSIQEQYQHSALSRLYPNLDLGKTDLIDFFHAISLDRRGILNYMKFMWDVDDKIALLDGHGQVSALRKSNNVIRLCSPSFGFPCMPQYYLQTYGATNGVALVNWIPKESHLSLEEVTVVGEAKDLSAEDARQVEDGACRYILGLQRGAKELAGLTPTFHGYDEAFFYHRRGIKHHTVEREDHKSKIVIYLDLQYLAEEGSALIVESEKAVRKAAKGKASELRDPLTRETGTFALRTNRMDLNAEEIYHLFQQSLAMREYWNVCGGILGADTSYVRHPFGEEGWLFLQHLSASIAAKALWRITTSGEWPDGLFVDGLVELVYALDEPETQDGRYVSPIPVRLMRHMPF